MSATELLSGNTKTKFCVAMFTNRPKLFSIDDSKNCLRFVEGAKLPATPKNSRDFYTLFTEGERPLFGKGFHVLALKNSFLELREPKTVFIPAVVNSWKKEKGRKMYNLTFDDGTSEYVYEELVIPPREYWSNLQKVYYLKGSKPVDAPRECESSSSSECESSSSSESESSSSSECENKHHKKTRKLKKVAKKHRKHSKKNTKRLNSPQIVIMPIFIPYFYGM